MALYEIKRNGFTLPEKFRPLDESIQQKVAMSVNIVIMKFIHHQPVHLQIGDYMDVFGERYYLNRLAEVVKHHSRKYEYDLTLEADYYSLAKIKFRSYDSENELTIPSFELVGTLEDFLDLVVANANRLQTGWIKGDFDSTEAKLIPFDGENVLQAIDQIAKEFDTEWWIINKDIHFFKKGSDSGLSFKYGYNQGLRGNLKRLNVNSQSVFSRLYVRGGDKNIPNDYRNGLKNLSLPSSMQYIQGPKYGPDEIEADIVFPDIFPQRICTITDVGDDVYTFADDTLDFNINDQIFRDSTGRQVLSAKIDFLTGDLAGYQFEIAPNGGFNPANKAIKILRNDFEKVFEMPSEDRRPRVGDTFSIVDIQMPAPYVEAKEQELLEKGTEYLQKNGAPIVSYEVIPDTFYFDREQIELQLGDYIKIKDLDLLVNRSIRVLSFERPLSGLSGKANPTTYTSLGLADSLTGSPAVAAVAEKEKLNKALTLAKVRDVTRSKINWRTGQELLNKYFDPEGGLYSDAISPATIRTLMLEIGSPSQQLELPGVVFTSNADQDENKINWTAGQLVHFTISEMPRTWDIAGAEISGLDPAQAYYVYAKCERIGTVGEIIISTEQIKVDQDAGFYYFWIGLANSVVDGYRSLKMLFGSVRVYGRTIEGGRIIGNQLDIDLDAGTVKGRVQMLDGSYTEGVLVVGEDGEGNAFISGVTDSIDPDQSVRFGAGGEYGDPDLPFQVLDDGTAIMKKVRISGDVIIGTTSGTTSEGYTAGWKVSGYAILSDGHTYPSMVGGNNFALIRASSRYPGDKYNEYSFGTELIPSSAGGVFSQVGRIRNNRPQLGTIPGLDDTTNFALELEASGANKNIALKINSGEIQLKDGSSDVIPLTGMIKMGSSAGGRYPALKVVNGMIIDAGRYSDSVPFVQSIEALK